MGKSNAEKSGGGEREKLSGGQEEEDQIQIVCVCF